VDFSPDDAVATIGGMCMRFVLEPETFPVFFEWICALDPAFRAAGLGELRADVRRVLDLIPLEAAL